jgi:WD40 repeat protein
VPLAVSDDGGLVAFRGAGGSSVSEDPGAIYLIGADGGDPRGLQGHQAAILCAAFSPDGKTLLSGGMDNVVRFWDVATGQALGHGPQGKSHVYAIDFRPPGGQFVVLGDGISVWDLASRRELRKFEDPSRGKDFRLTTTFAGAFAPDGKKFASRHSAYLGLWDFESGRLLSEVKAGFGRIDDALAFTPDGKRVLHTLHDAASGRHGPHSWDLTTGTLEPEGTSDHFFSPLGPTGVFSADGHYRVWFGFPNAHDSAGLLIQKTERGAKARPFTSRGLPPVFRLNRDGTTLACGADDGSLNLIDTARGQVRRALLEPLSGVRALAWSADGRTIRTWTADGVLHDWDTATAKEVGRGRLVPPKSYQPPPVSGGRIWIRDADAVRIWDVATGKVFALQGEVADQVNRNRPVVGLSPLGAMIVAMTWEDGAGRLTSWDAATGRQRHSFPVPEYSNRVGISDDGRIACAHLRGDDKGTITVWEVVSGKVRQTLHAFPRDGGRLDVGRLCAAPDGKTVAAFGVRYADTRPRSDSTRLGHPAMRRSAFQEIWVWDVREAKLLAILRADPRVLTYSPDGRKLAYADGCRVQVYDLGAGKVAEAVTTHGSPIMDLAFSPDGRALASGSEDATVLQWDVAALAGGSRQK